jgi:hypothetical protein
MYDSSKIEKEVYLQLIPEHSGSYLRALHLGNATSRRPRNPQGLVVKVTLRLDRKMFAMPELVLDVKDTRVEAEAEGSAVQAD